jgi:hypothetical protein
MKKNRVYKKTERLALRISLDTLTKLEYLCGLNKSAYICNLIEAEYLKVTGYEN